MVHRITFFGLMLAWNLTGEPLQVPTVFYAEALDGNRVQLNWVDNNTDEGGYQIFRNTASSPVGAGLILETGVNANAAVDIGLSPNTTYYYFIRAIRGNDLSFLSLPFPVSTPNGIPPAPAGLLAESLNGSQIKLSWADSPNESSYEIYESPNSFPASAVLIATLPANSTVFVRTGLSALTAYSYFIKAANLYGASPFSPGSSAVTLAAVQAPLIDFEPGTGWPSCAPGTSWNQSISWSTNGWSFKDMGFNGNDQNFPYYRGGQGVIGKNPASWMQTLVTNPVAVEFYISCSAYGPGLPDWTISVQTAPVTNSNSWTTHAIFGNISSDLPAKAPTFNYKCLSNLGLSNGAYFLRFYKDNTTGNPNAYIDDIRIVSSGQSITGPDIVPSLASLTELLHGYPPVVPLRTHPENVLTRKKLTSWLDTYASAYAQLYNMNDTDPATYDDVTSNEICGWYRTRVQKVVDELTVTHPVGDEVAVWKMYSSGFIVRTASTTFAIDLIEGPNRNNMGAGKSTEVQNIAFGMSDAQINALVDQIDVFFVSHSHHDHTGLVILTNAMSKGKIVVGGTNNIPSDPDSAGEVVNGMYSMYSCFSYGKILDPYLGGGTGRNNAGEGATYDIGKLKVRIHYGIQRGTPGLSVRCYSYHITTPENFSVMSTADQKDVAGGQTASQASNDSILPWLTRLGSDGAHLNLYLGAVTVFAPVFLERLFSAFSSAQNFNTDRKILRVPGHEWEWAHWPGGFNLLYNFWNSAYQLNEDIFPLAIGEKLEVRNPDHPGSRIVSNSVSVSPFQLRATALADTVILEWNKREGAKSYRVYRKNPGDAYFLAQISTAEWGARDTKVRAGECYVYFIAGVDGEGRELDMTAQVSVVVNGKDFAFKNRIGGETGPIRIYLSERVQARAGLSAEIFGVDGKKYLARVQVTGGNVVWDGKLENGNNIPPGNYLIAVKHGDRGEVFRGAMVIAR